MKFAAIAGSAVVLSACATIEVPYVVGGPAQALDPTVADTLAVRYIRVDAAPRIYREYQDAREADWAQRDPLLDMEFNSTVEEELREELSRCATGSRVVDLTILITDSDADPRLRSLLDGNGANTLGAIVEVVEPAATGRVIGRYRLEVGARSGNLLERIVGDKLMNTAEMLGREMCLQVFGRNPRPPSILNSTDGSAAPDDGRQ